MRKQQQGSVFGTLIILALFIGGGYYLYKTFIDKPPEPPTCKAKLSACSVNCRRTATEAPAMQSCQEACQRDAAACKD